MSDSAVQQVASQSFLNQSSILNATTVYTPTENALLRVSMYQESSSGTLPTVTILYTDPVTGSQIYQFPLNNCFAVSGDNFGVAIIRVSRNTSVQVSATTPVVTYNLFVVVEEF
jgi:hypothetical protein